MKIGEFARRTGLSVHTLRYYERIGLLPRAPRGETSKQRDYDASLLPWIDFLGRLKTTGMPIRDMLRYAELRAQGPATAAARRDLLARHRETVSAHVAALTACLSVLDDKIAFYEGQQTETPDDPPLQQPRKQPPRKQPLRQRATGARRD